MPLKPAFTITYWGVTGTLTAPLKPPEVTDKIVRAIQELVEQGCLANLKPGAGNEPIIRRLVEDGLPFYLRSTFGGNTTCVEVQTPENLFILDCGSGLRELGIALERRWNAPGYEGPRTAHVLLTHPHIDHIVGTPFARPFYDERNHFSLWGTRSVLDSLAAVLSPDAALSHTYFPPSYDLMKALKDFHELKPGDDITIGGTRIRTFALNHPGGCLAYRLENAGRVFVFATDHEHQEVPDRGLAAFAQGADLFYTEGQYLAAEYEGRKATPGEAPLARQGWGHSPVEACVITAAAAQVRELHLGHREPTRDDEKQADLEHYLQQLMREELRRQGRGVHECRALVPYEGMTKQL